MNISRLLTPAIAMLLTAVSASADTSLKWLETTHDFGAFDEDMGKVTATFRFVNTGNEPVMIYAARASCGCTVPSYTTDPVTPGDTATIKVIYDPTGRPGKFDKKVKVETNTQPRQSVLSITGSVIGASNTLRSRFPIDAGMFKLRKDIVPFGEILKGRTKTAFLEGYNQSADTISPSLEGLPRYIKVQVAPGKVPPGEQVTFTLFYNSSSEPEWGLVTHEGVVIANGPGTPQHKVDVTAIINEDFSTLSTQQRQEAPRIALSETSVDFGRIEKGRELETKVTIDNFGKNELVIRRLSCPDQYVKLKLSKNKVKGGGNATLTIKINTAKSDDTMLNTRVTIITNDPDRPVSTIRITGEYIN